MSNVKTSISISRISRSWVAIYQLHPPIASLSQSLYDMPGFALRMNVLFWGRHDFQISFSNVKERLKSSSKKFYGRYRDLIKQYEVPLSRMLNNILYPDQIQWQSSTNQISYRTQPFTDLYMRGYHKTFATGVAYWQRTLTPPDTWSRPIWDLHM